MGSEGVQVILIWLRQDLVFSLQSEVMINGLGGRFASMFGRFAGTGFGFGSGQILTNKITVKNTFRVGEGALPK